MRLDQSSWMEVRDRLKQPQGIIISTGPTEQHGPIGVIGTDTICSDKIETKVADKKGRIVAQAIRITPAKFNMNFSR